MRNTWLKLTDARLRASLSALEAGGRAAGDMAAAPELAAGLMRPARAQLSAAIRSGPRASLEAAYAAEDFSARLEKVFSDMALLSLRPDAVALEALGHLQRACEAAGGLLSPSARNRAAGLIRAHCASGRRGLALACAAEAGEGPDFPRKLKFSSIYSGLDAALDALERCAEALFRI